MNACSTLSRRSFLSNLLLSAAASAFLQAQTFLTSADWVATLRAQGPDVIHDTLNGLIAFVVPGRDQYSMAQGVSTLEPGGIDAGVTDDLIATLDASTPFLPQFSATVAAVLNGLAQLVDPAAPGTFVSPFARLSFAEKAAVFQIMDATDSLELLAGVLPAFVAAFSYSEAGAFDPATRSLTREPTGWQISGYQGVSDGRAEFVGYFENRKRAS